MTNIKNVIDETQDYTLIKSGAGRTLVLVKKNGFIKGKVLCKNFMDLDLDNDENINENECPDFLLNKFFNYYVKEKHKPTREENINLGIYIKKNPRISQFIQNSTKNKKERFILYKVVEQLQPKFVSDLQITEYVKNLLIDLRLTNFIQTKIDEPQKKNDEISKTLKLQTMPKELLNSLNRTKLLNNDDKNEINQIIQETNDPKVLQHINAKTNPDEVNNITNNAILLLSAIKEGKKLKNNLHKIPELEHKQLTATSTLGFNTDFLDRVPKLSTPIVYHELDAEDWETGDIEEPEELKATGKKGGNKHSHKKTYHKRDKFGRFIKRKTRKSSGGWLY